MILCEELTRAPQLVAYAWHNNGRPYVDPRLPVKAPAKKSRKKDSIADILSEIRNREFTEEELTLGGPYINWDVLAAAVADLDPTMRGREKTLFKDMFVEYWKHVESTRRLDVESASAFAGMGNYTDDQVLFMRRLNGIVFKKTPVGSCARKRISKGDKTSYPEVLKHMHVSSPQSYGDHREWRSGRDFQLAPVLTHRQLSLHAEFAPLLAAIFLSSRMPRALINGSQVKRASMRPLPGQLLDVLLLRRPDNLEDEFLLWCVRWLMSPRDSLLVEPNFHMLG
jgi:hypothetical protein